jgi:hypothetical protein
MSSVRVLRHVAAVVAALALAVPASGGFMTRDHHDTLCPQMQERCGHHSVVLTCCCDEDSGPASNPSTPSSQGAPSASAAASTAAPPAAIVPVFAAPSQSALRLASPPHGYRTIDLPVLFSTFLI